MAKKYIDVDSLGEFLINEYLKTTDNDSYVLFALGYMAGAIEKMPSADVRENVRGEWIKDGRKWMCDKCGELVYDDDHNFCPNCGADMRGDNNETD